VNFLFTRWCAPFSSSSDSFPLLIRPQIERNVCNPADAIRFPVGLRAVDRLKAARRQAKPRSLGFLDQGTLFPPIPFLMNTAFLRDEVIDNRSESIPTVSVIIPTFNRAHLVGRAIRSVLAQTYRDFELIVVDDGSDEDPQESVNSFDDPRIRYIRLPENRGSSAAFNTGIGAARGEYLGFLADDDEWLPEKLELQMEFLGHSRLRPDAVYTAAYAVNSATGITTLKWKPEIRGNLYQTLLKNPHLNFCTLLVKRELVLSVGGFDENMPRGMDRDFLIRLAKVATFDGITEPLVRSYFNRGPHLRGNLDASIRYKQLLLAKFSQDPSVPGSILAYHHHSLSRFLIRQSKYKCSFVEALKGLRTAPIDPRSYLVLLEILFFMIRGKHS